MCKKRIIISVSILLLIILWAIFIYKLSSMNSDSSNYSSKGIISVFIEDTLEITNKFEITNKHPSQEKIDRASELLINYILKNKKIYLSILISLLIVISLASFDEYHQTYIEGRTGQIKDVCIDSIGGFIGIIFFLHII